jgi:DNA-binding NarL/FixJ family response regulator
MIYIAIVDDHTIFRRGLAALISLFPGYKVLLDAANGREFIQALKPPHYPDIVLLDVAMPVMDGYETAEWIRVNLPSTRVLALSTMDNDTAILKMIKHGARGYLLKDADTSELKLAFNDVQTKGYYYNEVMTRKVLTSMQAIINTDSDAAACLHLTEREVEFLKLACTEKTYKEIAAQMYLSERTIDGYRENMFRKLNVNSRVGLVLFAIKNGLVKI